MGASERNSDLKREYERRITGLNRQTKRAVVEIVRTRLDQESKEKEEKDENCDNESIEA